jgi:hypothetical protein
MDLGDFKGPLVGLAVAVVTCVVSMAVAVGFIVLIPANYFDDEAAASPRIQHPILRWTAIVFKNALGIVLVCVGVVMLVTPGQGVLTIVVGIMLMSFPGKRKLMRAIVGRAGVRKAINNLRERFGKPPLEIQDT